MSSESNKSFFQFPEVHVVEASAGSGKTYALAKRYVQLLLNGKNSDEVSALRSILAVTFTNKAAFKMKARILEFVKRIALDQLNDEERTLILGPMHLDRDTARRGAFLLMDELILHYNFFQIQTIDSFINAILSGCSFNLGLSANFRIKRNSSDYLELSLDRLINRAQKNPEIRHLFDNLLHQYLYLENRTSWFPKKDILSLMGSLFSQTNTYGLEFSSTGANSRDLLEIKKGILDLIRALKDHLPEKTDQRFRKSLDNFLSKSHFSFDVDWVSDYFSRPEFPANKGALVELQTDRLWDDIRDNLRRLCLIESTMLFQGYIEIFNRISDDVRNMTAREDIIFLEELNKKARSLFDHEGLTVQELYFRLATRFRHYLIDEFQDTSVLQWQNLKELVEEALSSGGSLFYVGDRKQAIYGFRGGEIRLFDQVQKNLKAFNVTQEALSTNYRSQKAIVEFNNTVFSPENLRRFMIDKENFDSEKKKKNAVYLTSEEKDGITHIFEHSRQEALPDKSEGYVKVEFIDADAKDERDQSVEKKTIALIKELRSRFSLSDIAILARNNSEVESITSWLLNERIFVESERTSSIKENFLIKEFISFLKFLESPVDNVSFASFILGDIFLKKSGLDITEMSSFVFRLRHRTTKEKDFYLYKEFRSRYPDVWSALIEEFFKNVGLYPLYELVLSIVHRYDCILNFPAFQGFLMRFLELLKDQEEDHADISSFLEYFETITEDLFLNTTDLSTVKVLTIHKSKGLEFPVVIIPFLGMDVQVGSSGQGERTYIVHETENRLELLHLKQKYLNFSPELEEIYRKEYQKSFLSELNNVYVALTRAVFELYVFIPKRAGQAHNIARFLIPEAIWETGRKIVYPDTAEASRPIVKLPLSDYCDWIDLLKDEFIDPNLFRNTERILRGEMVHFVLSQIGWLKEGQEDQVIAAAVSQACERFGKPNERLDLEAVARRIVTHTGLRKFFYSDGEVFQEKEIVDAEGKSWRIDRLIVRDNEVSIVDYKSRRPKSDSYPAQVRNYMDIVSRLEPDKTIRGFIVYLDELSVDEILIGSVKQIPDELLKESL